MSYVILLSGGFDSAILWHYARTLAAAYMGPEPVAVFVDYGQPEAQREWNAARKIAGPRVMRLVARINPQEMHTGHGTPGPRVVPGRNLLLASLAVTQAHPGDEIWLGAGPGDAANYPDCRPTWVHKLSQVTHQAYGVTVRAPLVELGRSRREWRRWAADSGIDLSMTWSCYQGTFAGPCGTCDSCRQG